MEILHVLNGFNVGGAETFVYNLFSNINNDEYHFDFLIRNRMINNELLYAECKKKNSNIFITESNIKHPIKNFLQVNKILKENKYDCIHIHANALIYIIPILIAKKNNIKIVLHSHSVTNNKGGYIGRIVHYINQKIIYNVQMNNIACSIEAGKWMFGDREYMVIKNAVNAGKYKYSYEVSERLKRENAIKDEVIIGHAGRFVDVKNHEFLVEVFYEYQKNNSHSKLVLLGDGPLRKAIEEKCEELHIRDKVIFKGNVTNVNEYLMMFDICLFPSKFEGMSFFLIEAQAAGLPIIASESINKQGVITDLLFFESLENSSEIWAKSMEQILGKRWIREKYAEQVESSEFSIKVMVREIEKIYGNNTIK